MELSRIAELAKEDPERKFCSIAHFLTPEALYEAFLSLRKDASAGVRLVEFGRAALARAIRAKTRPDTFDFLGLTHKCALSRRGKFTVHVKTMKKRLRRSFKAVAEWCRTHRHDAVDEQQAILNAKLRGHYQYYGRPTNYRSLWQFYRGVRQTWKKWLERRSRGQPSVGKGTRRSCAVIRCCARGSPTLGPEQ
jgi:hypothetical protein